MRKVADPCSSHDDTTPKQSERDAVGGALFPCRPLLKVVTDSTLTHALLLGLWIRCFTMIIPAKWFFYKQQIKASTSKFNQETGK